jgi:thiamine-phosphate pyrophosphorylase
MVHSHYELMQTYQLKGIHFPEREKRQIPLYKNINCVKSTSIHSLEAMKEVPMMIDYVFLSPIFPSVSKHGYDKKWNFMEIIRLLNGSREFEVVALGGVTFQNIIISKELGFDDYAVLGSIWEPYKNGATTTEVIDLFKHLKYEF